MALCLALLISLLCPLLANAVDAPARLLFLGNAALPPMVWDHNGKAEGVAVDLAKAATEKAGLAVDIRGADWLKAQDDLRNGRADALIHINPNPERLALFDFSDALLESKFHIFRKNKQVEITDIHSLAGKRVGVESGGFPITYLRQHEAIHVVVVDDWKQAFEKLQTGQIDAVFVDRWVGEYVLFQYKIGDVVLVDPPVVSLESRIAVKKGNASLLASINSGLHKIDQDGTRRAILSKWQAKEVVYLTREAFDRLVEGGALAAVSILLVLSTWLYFQGRKLKTSNRELERRMIEITDLQVRLSEQAIRDPLTGLHNRRYLDETSPRELSRAKREGHPLAIVMLDLDHFKRVNDTYGHAAGDEVLKGVSAILCDGARKSDIVCRYGGEEFLVALPNMSVQQAMDRAEQWREKLQSTTFQHGDFSIAVTFSAGIAAYPVDGTDMDTLVFNADQALYSAKNAGRNRIACYQTMVGVASAPETTRPSIMQ